MKLWCTVFLVILGTVGVARAAEKPYQTGKIVDVQQKVDTRILYYLVNTPITQDDPYYEVSVQLGDTIYRGVHTPRHRGDRLPEDWKPEAEVQARIDGHHLYVKRPNGPEVEFAIAKRRLAKPGTEAATPEGKK